MISCIGLTYARNPPYQYLIEECIESFCRQDWDDDDKELIVLNDGVDEHGQVFSCDPRPGVRIVNHPERYPTLGDKYNAAIEMTSGEFLCPWEDDDISLPHRLAMSIEKLGDCDYYNPHNYWYLDSTLHSNCGVGVSHNCSMFRRSAWIRVGGYPSTSCGQDTQMDALLHEKCAVSPAPRLPIEDCFFIYRWGVSAWHLSACWPECQTSYDQSGQIAIERGEFHLTPHWQQEYVALCREAIEKGNRHGHHI